MIIIETQKNNNLQSPQPLHLIFVPNISQVVIILIIVIIIIITMLVVIISLGKGK